jgi:hypothetical protein
MARSIDDLANPPSMKMELGMDAKWRSIVIGKTKLRTLNCIE